MGRERGEDWRSRLRSGEQLRDGLAAEAIAEWRLSGLSLSAFAREAGVSSQRLSYWRTKLAGEARAEKAVEATSPVPASEITFLPLVVRAEDRVDEAVEVSPVVPAPVRLVVGSAELHIHEVSRVPAAWLAELLHELRTLTAAERRT